jgi:hypothetical protein
MKDFMDVCGAAERSLAKETVYTEELVETSAGSVLVAFSGDRYRTIRGLQGDVVYLILASRFMSPNAGGGGVAGSQPMSTAVHIT